MDNLKNREIESNKNFGIIFFIVFLILALIPLKNNGEIKLWSLIISIIFLYLAIINSKILTPFKKIWIKLGMILGKVISPLIMGLIFFLIITPIGLIIRLFGKDLLNLKFNKKKSYWIEKKEPKSKMKNQY